MSAATAQGAATGTVEAGRSELAREIRLSQFFNLAFGAIIGVSWLILLGQWLEQAGPLGAVIGFGLGTALVMTVGLCYAELATTLPVAGGEVAYAYAIFGPRTSFAVGWFLIMVTIAVTSFEAVSVGWVASWLFPDARGATLYTILGQPVEAGSLALGLGGMAVITGLNYVGARWAARFQDVLTYGLIVLALAFVAAGMLRGDTANLQPLFQVSHGSIWPGILAVFLISPVFLGGFNLIPQLMEESAPGVSVRLVGQVILLSIGMAGLFYALVIVSSAMVVPWRDLVKLDLPVAGAFRQAFRSELLVRAILLAALCGLVTTWNARYMAASRLLFALGRARIIPPAFGRSHARYGTPTVAVLFVGVLGAAGALLGRGLIAPIVNVGGAVVGLTYLLVCYGVIRLRRREPERRRPYAMPGGLVTAWVATLGSLLQLGFALYQPFVAARGRIPTEWLLFAGWAALGALLWWVGRRGRESVGEEERRRLMLGEDA